MSSTTYWNIRVFNMPHKHMEVSEFVRRHGIDIVGLLDTRVQYSKMLQVMNNCLPRWEIETNYSLCSTGKIWVCWQGGFDRVACVNKDEQQITLEFTKINGDRFCVTMVYASTNMVMRRELRNALIAIEGSMTVQWVVIGDFNLILNLQERVGGPDIQPYHFVNFLDCVNIIKLSNMRYRGNFLTCNNRQENRIACKLDRVLTNTLWMGYYDDYEADF